ncbi:hypothetical protein [Streptomyces sp. NPDC102437]|uniref:hypothetical protein n=1 Tax=Streptomyces sp. NPDC102437 TaxID=3366175 RepID=UPI00380E00F4
MTQALPHEVQILAEIGQAAGQGVQLGVAATGSVGAAPLRGGFEHLVQPGHRAEVVRERLVEQLGELLGTGGGEAIDPVAREPVPRCAGSGPRRHLPHGLGGLVAVRLTAWFNSIAWSAS